MAFPQSIDVCSQSLMNIFVPRFFLQGRLDLVRCDCETGSRRRKASTTKTIEEIFQRQAKAIGSFNGVGGRLVLLIGQATDFPNMTDYAVLHMSEKEVADGLK